MLFVSVPTKRLQDQLVELGAEAHSRLPDWEPHVDSIAVVVGVDPVDVHLALGLDCEIHDIESLWSTRVRTFEANLRNEQRAPRRQSPVLSPPDTRWSEQAERLIARLRKALGPSVHRIDHIGSTSVLGLPAKNLIDIQVVAEDLGSALEMARKSRRAGFVRVDGDWFGEDREGTKFREEVAVDTDPGRPVNVNFRSQSDPVWRETLLFRNLLRTNNEERDNYAEMKLSLEKESQSVDDYGELKMSYIRAALKRTGTSPL